MVAVDNKSDFLVLVSVTSSSIPSFDAAPVLVVPGEEEKWIRGAMETLVIVGRHGWFACRMPPNGYVRIGRRNLYIVEDWADLDTHFYTWFDSPQIDFEGEGFPFTMEDVQDMCLMERLALDDEDEINEYEKSLAMVMGYGVEEVESEDEF